MTEEQEVKIQMEAWKDQYGSVFATEVNDQWFVWRQLSRGEFKKATEYYPENEYERAEYVCRLCVLDPLEFDYSEHAEAGIPEILVQNILSESGFAQGSTKIDRLMKEYEEEMTRFENQISCVIAECFPDVSIEEIENWSIDKTIWYFSRAKWMLETLRGVALTQDNNAQG